MLRQPYMRIIIIYCAAPNFITETIILKKVFNAVKKFKETTVLVSILMASTIAVSSDDSVSVIDVDQAISNHQENKVLKGQISSVNNRASNATPTKFSINANSINESELGTEAIRSLLTQADKAATKQMVANKSRGDVTKEQHVTGIADEDMAKLRYDTLLDSGINPAITGYIFVSESMPKSLIRAYSRDATRLGMSLVFNGFVDKGTTHNKFLELSKKYHTKRNAMALQADTRLFDAFEVDKVPSIVVTNIASLDICNDTGPTSEFTYRAEKYSFQKCNPAPQDKYCKISGSVFTDWAIKTMSEKGCTLASNFINKTQEQPATSQNTINKDLWEKYVSSYTTQDQEWTEHEKEIFKIMQGDFK
jgi:type-F conjugative transfer system pilin assembly protein TrbC